MKKPFNGIDIDISHRHGRFEYQWSEVPTGLIWNSLSTLSDIEEDRRLSTTITASGYLRISAYIKDDIKAQTVCKNIATFIDSSPDYPSAFQLRIAPALFVPWDIDFIIEYFHTIRTIFDSRDVPIQINKIGREIRIRTLRTEPEAYILTLYNTWMISKIGGKK